jgi:hypothetical protein
MVRRSMDLDPIVVAALVAAMVSAVVGVFSFFSNRSSVRHEVQQAQFKDVVTKRIELYPKLWRIQIHYETNWTLEGRPKNREWAQQYVAELNEFNLEGSVFFSEDLYRKFHQLRSALYRAIRETEPNSIVADFLAQQIGATVYGNGGPGLSTYIKDYLGSCDRHARGIDCAAGESVLQRPVDSCDVRTVAPAAILLEPAVLYTPSTAMYNAVMYTRVSSLARRDS